MTTKQTEIVHAMARLYYVQHDYANAEDAFFDGAKWMMENIGDEKKGDVKGLLEVGLNGMSDSELNQIAVRAVDILRNRLKLARDGHGISQE